eukprot:jgi/Hompol1/5670/HPOL_004638-RA
MLPGIRSHNNYYIYRDRDRDRDRGNGYDLSSGLAAVTPADMSNIAAFLLNPWGTVGPIVDRMVGVTSSTISPSQSGARGSTTQPEYERLTGDADGASDSGSEPPTLRLRHASTLQEIDDVGAAAASGARPLSPLRPVTPLPISGRGLSGSRDHGRDHSRGASMRPGTPMTPSLAGSDEFDQTDAASLAESGNITFYQGFKASYPRLAKPRSRPPGATAAGSSHTPSSSQLIVSQSRNSHSQPHSQSQSSHPSQKYGISRLPEKTLHQVSAIHNITRMFAELLAERDTLLGEADDLEDQRVVYENQLRTTEDQLAELNARKAQLTEALSQILEREAYVASQ